MIKGELYIDGKWTKSRSGKERDILNPFDASVIATVAEGDRNDTKAAIKAARHAFDKGGWPQTPASERGRLLFKLADLIERDHEELARLESLDTENHGRKPLGYG